MFGWCFGRTQISNAMSIVELLVHMDCDGCEKRVRKAISKLDGKKSASHLFNYIILLFSIASIHFLIL
ncbi:hypothetical protein ACSBR1_020875 [Camellia fascicularis]